MVRRGSELFAVTSLRMSHGFLLMQVACQNLSQAKKQAAAGNANPFAEDTYVDGLAEGPVLQRVCWKPVERRFFNPVATRKNL